MSGQAIELQRQYYAATADRYDDIHVHDDDEHTFALGFMLSVLGKLTIGSVLDIGSGTGRALLLLKARMSGVTMVGVEPSPELRAVGHAKGLSEGELVDGDAMGLPYADGAFDLVCEFGALHHIPSPPKAVAEMLRVARKAVFISDINNFGQGSAPSRFLKQAINAVGMWPLADRIKTQGKGYLVSDGDGVAYSYSVFNDYRQIERACDSIHMFNTSKGGPDLYRTASHVALLGIKRGFGLH